MTIRFYKLHLALSFSNLCIPKSLIKSCSPHLQLVRFDGVCIVCKVPESTPRSWAASVNGFNGPSAQVRLALGFLFHLIHPVLYLEHKSRIDSFSKNERTNKKISHLSSAPPKIPAVFFFFRATRGRPQLEDDQCASLPLSLFTVVPTAERRTRKPVELKMKSLKHLQRKNDQFVS